MEMYLALGAFALGFLVKRYFSNLSVIRDSINAFLIYLGLPFVVLYSATAHSDIQVSGVLLSSVILAAAFTVLVFLFVSRIKIPGPDKASLYLCSAFGNTAFLGIPISFLFFGMAGATIAGIMSFVLMVFHYSIGLVLANRLKGKSGFRVRYISRPFIWILLGALLLSQLNIRLPALLGNVSLFVSLLAVMVIGMSLDTKFLNIKVAFFSLIKLILVPLFALLALLALGTDHIVVFLLLSAMPSALMNTSLAIEFRYNERLASGLTTIGTLLFLVIITAAVIITTI